MADTSEQARQARRRDQERRPAWVAASAPASARPPVAAKRASTPVRAASSRTSKAVRRRSSAACRSAASTTRSRHASPRSTSAISRSSPPARRSTRQALRERGLVKGRSTASRSSATASSPRRVTVTAHSFSKAARTKIEKAGGKVVLARRRGRSSQPQRRKRHVRLLRLREHRQGAGAAQAGPLHARHARGLPHRRLRDDPGRGPERDAGGRAASRAAACSASSTCSPAARWATCRSSRSASCRTSARASSSSCSTMVFKPLDELRKEGEQGQRKINQYTRYGTIVLSLVQGFGIAMSLEALNNGDLADTARVGDVVTHPGWGFRLMSMLTLTTGTAFIMWVGEQITERGIGNGISLIIFAGIVDGIPDGIVELLRDEQGQHPAAEPRGGRRHRPRDRRDHRVLRARPAPDPDLLRAQNGRPTRLRRADGAPAAAREHRRHHPADLRLVAPHVPGDARELQDPGHVGPPVDAPARRLAVQHVLRRCSSSSFATSTRPSRSSRSTWRTT